MFQAMKSALQASPSDGAKNNSPEDGTKEVHMEELQQMINNGVAPEEMKQDNDQTYDSKGPNEQSSLTEKMEGLALDDGQKSKAAKKKKKGAGASGPAARTRSKMAEFIA